MASEEQPTGGSSGPGIGAVSCVSGKNVLSLRSGFAFIPAPL